MALKLDDLLVKKKEPVQILDLSKSTANSKEELKKLFEKVPEYKIKMDKVRPEDVKIYDKKFSFKTSKKEEKIKSFPFANPVPFEMKSLRLDDLCSVNIQWKMLTSLRPKSKLDEEYFSKLIDLGKLQLQAREKERKRPFTSYVKKSKNKAGILETKIISCRDCGEEFCIGETCKIFAYDSYERSGNLQGAGEELAIQENTKKDKKKKKIKKKKSVKKKIPSDERKSKSKPPLKQNLSKSEKPQSVLPTKKHNKPSVTANKIKKPQPSTQKGRNRGQKTMSHSGAKNKIPSKEQSEKNTESPKKIPEKEKPKKKSTKSKKKK